MATRKEIYLKAITEQNVSIPKPITREDFYLACLCGVENLDVEKLPTPITRTDQYLYDMCKTPRGGSVIEIVNPVILSSELKLIQMDDLMENTGITVPPTP